MFTMNQRKIRINNVVKKFIYKENGFTLIEMLLSFSIFSFIIVFIVHTIPLLKYHTYSTENLDQLHWEIFLNQMKREIRTVERIQIGRRELEFIKDTRLITYERYGEKVRRRVDYAGNETLLFNITRFDFMEVDKGIKVIVVHKNGKTYEGVIYIPNEIPIVYK